METLSTKLYNSLHTRIGKLESRLLPPTSPIGNYSETEYDFVRGYIVLVHAEIETYLEEVALELTNFSMRRWSTHGRVNRCLAALLLHHDRSATPLPKDMTTHLNTAASAHRSAVKNNHGVREKHVWAMFSPLGIDKSEVSTSLLAELESFGSARGKVAHLSARGVLNPPDPDSTKNQASLLVSELKDFDLLCQSAKHR